MRLRGMAAALAAGLALAASGGGGAHAARFGNWTVEDRDGSVVAAVSSDAGALLVLGCAAPDRLVAMVDYGEAVSIEDAVAVRWRVDAGPIQAQRWTVRPSRKVVTGEPALSAEAFLAALRGGRHLAVEAVGRRDVFDVWGVLQVSALLDCAPKA